MPCKAAKDQGRDAGVTCPWHDAGVALPARVQAWRASGCMQGLDWSCLHCFRWAPNQAARLGMLLGAARCSRGTWLRTSLVPSPAGIRLVLLPATRPLASLVLPAALTPPAAAPPARPPPRRTTSGSWHALATSRWWSTAAVSLQQGPLRTCSARQQPLQAALLGLGAVVGRCRAAWAWAAFVFAALPPMMPVCRRGPFSESVHT